MNDPHRNDDVKMPSSSSSNYSNLLPLVATVLNDKVAADAHDEINSLRRRNAILSSVNIMQQRWNNDRQDNAHDDDVTIASAQFQNGWFHTTTNLNLWRVDLNSSPPFSCRLADLKSCYVNVGGGFPVADFRDGEIRFEECWNFSGNAVTSRIEKYDGDNTNLARFLMGDDGVYGKSVRFWLSIAIHGWPREDWEDAMLEMDGYVGDDDLDGSHTHVDYLVEVVANKFPNATIEFLDVAFDISSMRGAFRKLIPDRRMLEAVAERDGRAFKKPKVQVSKTLATNTICNPNNAPLIIAFRECSAYYFKEGNRNAGSTYVKAIATLSNLWEEVTKDNAMSFSKGKTKLAGIGKSTAQKMLEFVTTGTFVKLEEKRAAHA